MDIFPGRTFVEPPWCPTGPTVVRPRQNATSQQGISMGVAGSRSKLTAHRRTVGKSVDTKTKRETGFAGLAEAWFTLTQLSIEEFTGSNRKDSPCSLVFRSPSWFRSPLAPSGPPGPVPSPTTSLGPSAGQSLNGISQFNGSFTINGDPTVGSSGSVAEGGSDVSLTVNMGGQVYNFVNQQNPVIVASFTAGESPAWIANPTGPPQDEAIVSGPYRAEIPSLLFGMSFYSPRGGRSTRQPEELQLPPGPHRPSTLRILREDRTRRPRGPSTSIELVSTPEPSTLAVFCRSWDRCDGTPETETAIGPIAIDNRS